MRVAMTYYRKTGAQPYGETMVEVLEKAWTNIGELPTDSTLQLPCWFDVPNSEYRVLVERLPT